MNFTSFTQLILKSLQEELGEGYTVLSGTVNKNNGVTRTGITIKREGQNAFPTIYIDHFYKEDMTKEEILLTADRLFESLADAELEEKVDLSGFAEFDSAREKIAYKVISAEKNRKLLKEIPHKIVHNLAVVYFYTVQEAPFYGNAVVLINNHHMRQWKSAYIRYSPAKKNCSPNPDKSFSVSPCSMHPPASQNLPAPETIFARLKFPVRLSFPVP